LTKYIGIKSIWRGSFNNFNHYLRDQGYEHILPNRLCQCWKRIHQFLPELDLKIVVM